MTIYIQPERTIVYNVSEAHISVLECKNPEVYYRVVVVITTPHRRIDFDAYHCLSEEQAKEVSDKLLKKMQDAIKNNEILTLDYVN